MSSTEESISGLEKLIGFIYRILFTIIPSGAFLCLSFLFLKFKFPDTIISISEITSAISPFWQAILPLCLIFSFSLFLESLDLFLFYYIMDFGNLTNRRVFGAKNISKLSELKNKDFNELYKNISSEGTDKTSTQLYIEKNHFRLALIKSLMFHPRVFNHIYYQLGREFVFNNLTLVILIVSTCFAPYVIATYYINEMSKTFLIYQVFQPVLIIIYLWFAYLVLKRYNDYKNNEDKSEFLLSRWKKDIKKFPYNFFALISGSVFLGIVAIAITAVYKNSLLIFIGFNFILFPIVISTIFKGFKEYYTVEQYYLAYYIEKYFSKNSNP